MNVPPELGSERFTRIAKAVCPYTVGVFGATVIILDAFIFPPPDTLTSGIGFALITGQGVIGLELFRRKGTPDA